MAAKGDTEIKMSFTTDNAAGARGIVKEIYRNQLADMKAMNRQSNILGTSMRKLGRSVMFGVAGFAGVSGVSAVFSSLSQGVTQLVSKTGDLEKIVTPLSSLGDNISNLSKIKKDVVQTAISAGRSTQDISNFFFDLQSNTGNLSAAIRDQLKKETLELAEVTGGDLVTAQNLLTKSFQIYGKEVESVNQLQNKLMLTQEQAALRFEDLAQRAPELMSAGQVVGLSLDEVLASIIGATKKSGSIEKTFTGMRNVFLLMEGAQKKGITLTGSYTEKLSQLRDQFSTNNAKMRKLFGQESVVAAKVLADSVDDVSVSLKSLQAVAGGADVAMEKLRKRFQDPGFALMRDFGAINQTIENAPNIAPGEASNSGLVKLYKKARLGAVNTQTATGGIFGPLGSLIGGIGGLAYPGFAAEGRDIVASQTNGEAFRAQMTQKFRENKAEDLGTINARIRNRRSGNSFGDPSSLYQEREQIQNRELQPFLQPDFNGPEKTRSRLESMAAKSSGEDKAHYQALIDKLDQNTRALEKNTAANKKGNNAQPGGARANSQEGL